MPSPKRLSLLFVLPSLFMLTAEVLADPLVISSGRIEAAPIIRVAGIRPDGSGIFVVGGYSGGGQVQGEIFINRARTTGLL